jgi:hypothetical protein
MAPEEFVPPLGLDPHPARQDIDLKPGDRLLFYTDGLVETRDRAGRFFGLDDHVAAALALPGLETAVKGVVRLLLEHAGDDLSDDVLLVLGEPMAIDVAETGGQEKEMTTRRASTIRRFRD